MESLTGRRAQILGWSRSNWAGLALVGCVFALAAALSWRRWSDVLVDFGLQLYLPWRISEGGVLYRDMMYLTGGPLSQHFNALLFKIFGVSLRTLIFANLAITAGILALVYRRFLAAADRLTATMICLGIVLVFAFQHYHLIGNYNYVTPYCHEVFHGLALSIMVVAGLSGWIEKKKIRSAAAAGFGSGLVFLTKPDIFMALLICIGMAFLIVCLFHKRIGFAAKSLVAFLLAGLVPLLGFFMFFLQVEDWRASVRSTLFAWVPLRHTSLLKDPFYQWVLGLDTPFTHLKIMVAHFILIVVVITLYAMAFRSEGDLNLKWLKSPWRVSLLFVSLLLVLTVGSGWIDCGRSLPLLGLSACGLLGLNYRQAAIGQKAVFPFLWNIFGLALLTKMGFFTRIWHYGFALAMPAFMGAVYLLVWLIPVLLEQKYRARFHPFRLAVCLVLATVFVRLFLCSEHYYCQKNVPVGRGGDEIMAYGPSVNPFHDNVQLALSWIEKNVPPHATLAALPEGTMINYLSRRVNPNPYLVWVPPQMEVFGQTNMTAAFEKNSPDYVLVIARNTSEFGMGYFGYYPRYGTELMQWIESHYDPVYPAGKFPAGNQPFSELRIMKQRLPAAGDQLEDTRAAPAGKN